MHATPRRLIHWLSATPLVLIADTPESLPLDLRQLCQIRPARDNYFVMQSASSNQYRSKLLMLSTRKLSLCLRPSAVALAGVLMSVGFARASTPLDLDSYRGQVVYIDFWASWCTPCRQSFPWMESMLSQHGQDGLVVIAINLDRSNRTPTGSSRNSVRRLRCCSIHLVPRPCVGKSMACPLAC